MQESNPEPRKKIYKCGEKRLVFITISWETRAKKEEPQTQSERGTKPVFHHRTKRKPRWNVNLTWETPGEVTAKMGEREA